MDWGAQWASCSIPVLNYLQDGVNNFVPLVPLNVKHEEAITTTGRLLLNSELRSQQSDLEPQWIVTTCLPRRPGPPGLHMHDSFHPHVRG